MELKFEEKTVREIFDGYCCDAENKIVAYGGKLNVHPAFQREFFYNENQQEMVIETVKKRLPLNIIYWMEDDDGNYELLDGQQRIISICKYINGEYCVKNKYFTDLTKEEQEQILDYTLMIYICKGTDKEKLDWFKTLNTMGEELLLQELRNAIYRGKWLENAKQYFSKLNCPAFQIGNKYLKGSPIRHDYLETALKWISYRNELEIEDYMALHQNDTNANELWFYFEKVINWVETVFPFYRREMQGIEWGLIYNKYRNDDLSPQKLEEEIKILMLDDEVTNKSGIYEYVLTKDKKHLKLRVFSEEIKKAKYEKQKGTCPFCRVEKREKYYYDIDNMELLRIRDWSAGGKTEFENCILLCKEHSKKQSDNSYHSDL